MKEVDFDTVKEDWNEYKLKDGSTLKLKLALVKIMRTDNYDQFGDPIYAVNSANLVKVSNVPKNLKKKEDKSYVR